MACIVGLEHEGKVYMAGDSSSSSGYDKTRTRISKVFRPYHCPQFLIGYTSSFRMGQLIQYKLKVDIQKNSNDDYYLCTNFIDSVRACLKDGGYTKIDSNQEEGGFFLLGYKEKLYQVCSDFQVNSSTSGYDAIGCGDSYALGALYATQNLKEYPELRLTRALDAACEFSACVSEPYKLEVLE